MPAALPRSAREVDIGQCPTLLAAPDSAAVGCARLSLVAAIDAGDSSLLQPFPLPPLPPRLTLVDPGLLWSPRLVVEALGTGTIPADLAAILTAHSWTVRKDSSACTPKERTFRGPHAVHSQTIRKDGSARTPEERTVRGLHSFLSHILLWEVPVPSLEHVTLVGVDKDGRVNLMHSLFCVRVEVYSTECRHFTCLGELPAKGLPLVIEDSRNFFVAWRSVCAVPQKITRYLNHQGGGPRLAALPGRQRDGTLWSKPRRGRRTANA